MALRTIVVRFNTNVSTFTSDMSRAAGMSQRMQREFDQQARAMARYNASLAAGVHNQRALDAAARHAAAGLQAQRAAIQGYMASIGKMGIMMGGVVAAGFGKSIQMAMQFEKQMRDVQAISVVRDFNDFNQGEFDAYRSMVRAGVSETEALARANEMLFQRLSASVLELSRNSEHRISDVAETLYDISSAGFTGSRALEVLAASSKAATAGQTDMKTAATGILTILNAYGEAAPSLTKVNDVLFQTVRAGVIRFEELSHTMGQFVGIAAVAGLKTEEWGAAIATFTRAGIPAAQAGTTLNRVLSTLLKPGQALSIMLKEVGIDNVQTALSTEGLSGVMNRLSAVVGDNVSEWMRLFPQFRSARGALALVTAQGALYRDVLKDFTNEERLAGSMAAALAENQKTLSYQMGQTRNSIQATATELGTQLLPMARSVVEFFRGIGLAFGNMDDAGKRNLITAGKIVIVLGLLGGAMLALIPRIVATRAALQSLGAAGSVAASGFTLLMGVLGIAALALGAYAYAQSRAALATQHSKDRIDAHVEALKADAEAARNAGNVYQSAADKQANLRKSILTEFINEGDLTRVKELSKDYKISITDLLDSATGVGDARARLQKQFSDMFKFTEGVSPEVAIKLNKEFAQILNGNKELLAEWNREGRFHSSATGAQGEKYKQAYQVLSTLVHETKRAKDAQKEYTLQLEAENKEDKRAAELRNKVVQAQKAQMIAAGQVARGLGEEADAVVFLGEMMVGTNGEMEKLTATQKALHSAINSFVGEDAIFKEAEKRQAASIAGMRDGAEVAKGALDDIRDQAKKDADAETKSRNEALETANEQLDERTREQVDTIRDAAQRSADAVKNPAAAKRIRESAEERIAAIEKAARAEKRANDDAREQATKNREAAVADLKLSAGTYVQALAKEVDKANEYRQNIQAIYDKAGEGVDPTPLIESIQKMGEDGIPLMKEFAEGLGTEIDKAVGSLKKLAPEASTTLDQYEKVLKERVTAMSNWQANLLKLTSEGYGEIAQVLARQGIEGAGLVQEAVDRIGTEDGRAKMDELQSVYKDAGKFGSEAFAKGFESQLSAMTQIVANGGKISMTQLAEAMQIDKEQAVEIVASISEELAKLHPELALNIRLNMPDVLPPMPQAADPTAGLDQALATAPTSTAPAARSTSRVRVQANGGITYFGRGSERHVAQIAKAGDWRVWAEPETGGEAYIPLSAQKRHRSVAILGQVAEQFGYGLMQAENGVIRPPGAQFFQNGGMSGGNRTVIQPVTVPMAKSTTYQFGDLNGPTMRDIQEYAERQARVAALTGVPVGA